MLHVFPIWLEKWARRDAGGCWLWVRARNNHGYGVKSVGSRTDATARNVLAHRWVYEGVAGAIPGGLCVLHKCDTPSCVNPRHMFLGTKANNTADARQKGRLRGGLRLLSDEDCREIKALSDRGLRRIDVAKRFGVKPQTISGIVCGTERQRAFINGP